ncbi:ShlB/FhaC/HecB family hemolysin secretion/activation protein [Desulfobacterota bacterium M19]
MNKKGRERSALRRGVFIFLAVIMALVVMRPPGLLYAAGSGKGAAFSIRSFSLTGNTLFDDLTLLRVLLPFIGPDKTAADVEAARDALEKFYHAKGYPAVLVNIPEQTVENGIIRLGIVESRLRKVRVSGNKYHTMAMIMKQLPALRPGEILYLPKVQRQLAVLNSDPDMKVTPVLMPGRDPGTIDMELKVKDRLPLHGSLELNNRYSHDTTHLRLNGSIRYDNLWQKRHSLSAQFQISPEKLNEVLVLSASYVMPAPWKRDNKIILYAISSDSETAFGEGFQVKGKGRIYGLRYLVSLPPYHDYSHNISMGIDYKDFDESLGFASTPGKPLKTPITYMPISFSYSSQLARANGSIGFSASLHMAFRNMVTDQRQFEVKRYRAKGDYMYLTLGVEQSRKLPYDLGLYVKVDGQIANEPLIANEQYSAGGMESVRGYLENEDSGDNAVHGTVELSARRLESRLDFWPRSFSLTPYGFADFARLWTKDPLPKETAARNLAAVGLGARGQAGSFVYRCDLGVPLVDSDRIKQGDYRFYFKMAYEF